MADPAVANRWNWNTPFILSRHNPMVYYVGANKLFKSVKRGEGAGRHFARPLARRTPTGCASPSGFDAEGNPATDASGGITRDATGAEENGTIVTIDESPLRRRACSTSARTTARCGSRGTTAARGKT